MCDNNYLQSAQTTKEGFIHVLRNIYQNPVFFSQGRKPQLPVPHQLALTLEWLGTYGNGASIGCLSQNLSVGRGTVVKVTRRILTALLDLGKQYFTWPDQERQKEISEVMQLEGFDGCVGFVDGTNFPLFQRPGKDGEVFFDCKKRYSINTQIVCDFNKYITSFMTGWPGLCADSFIFKKMALEKFFDQVGSVFITLYLFLNPFNADNQNS
jgi:hypothetical protein